MKPFTFTEMNMHELRERPCLSFRRCFYTCGFFEYRFYDTIYFHDVRLALYPFYANITVRYAVKLNNDDVHFIVAIVVLTIN